MSLISRKYFPCRHLRHYLKCIYVKNIKENKFFEEVSSKQLIPLLIDHWQFKYHSESYSELLLQTFWSKSKLLYWEKMLTGNYFPRGNNFVRKSSLQRFYFTKKLH